jgi:prepilin-type processing-associated H-X9-DG protein
MSMHPGGVNAGLVDGSVHFLQQNIDLTLLQALATIARGEPVSLP